MSDAPAVAQRKHRDAGVIRAPPSAHATRSAPHAAPSAMNAESAVGNLAIQRQLAAHGVQAKLSMSQPGDPDEREADRMADRIVGSGTEAAPAKCTACAASGSTCPKCAEEKKIQRKALPGAGQAPSAHVPGLRGAGHPLAAPIRVFFEPHFGADLGNVRVHTDDSAGRTASSIGARAFTLGSDIAFARNQYSPETSDGKRLLAHELTHVMQQSEGGPSQRIARDVWQKVPADVADPAAKGPAMPSQKPDAPPKGNTIIFEGVLLGTNMDYVIPVMRQYIATHGEDEAKDFRKRLGKQINKQIPADDRSALATAELLNTCPTESLSNDAQIYVAVNESLEEIFRTNKKWLEDFEKKANEVVLGMLQESEDRVNEEMIRYGIDWKTVQRTRYRPARGGGLMGYKASETEYSMQDTPGSRALADAATGLLTRKHTFDVADKAMDDYGKEEVGGNIGELARQRFGDAGDQKKLDHLNELRAVRNHAKRDMDVFRIQKSAEFPILAAYASDEEISESKLETLQELAKAKSPAATNMMGEEIKTRLEHIADVRKDITEDGGKETKIWRVSRIIDGTREMTGATPGTMYGRLVDDKVHDEAPGIWTGILIGLLQLVLVLAAPFTAGLSLIPAAAISVGQAYMHFREYERAQMLHGTDFGALALSSEDPSLFWLAVDIIGAGFDVGAAAGAAINVFRALAPAARAARAAQAARSAERIEETARNLEHVASEFGGPALARTVGRDVRMGNVTMKVGETAEEAKALAHAGEEMAATELRTGAGEAESIAGRTVKVSEGGGLWSCASPCTLLRERYKGLLRNNKSWETKVKNLEDEAAKIPKGAAGAEARQEIAKRAAALEKEMRTTAKPGEWTSKLKEDLPKREFDELVERRGTVAAKLDNHPKNWTGADEARFRYGKKVEAEPGYRFTLDESGELRYDRLDATLPPHSYNTATGLFDEATEGGTLLKASKGTEEAHAVADIPKKQRDAMEAAFKKRGDFIAERDRLEALEEAGRISKKDSEKLRKLYAQINEESRQMGENAAEAVMKGKGGKKLYPTGKTYSTSGDFDQVWKKGERFQVVEGKGGSSGLGSRAIKDGVRAEQGTVEYAKSIAENMAKNGATKDIRKLGRDLLAAIADGKVDYILVRAPIGEKLGAAVMSDVKVSEFLLKPQL